LLINKQPTTNTSTTLSAGNQQPTTIYFLVLMEAIEFKTMVNNGNIAIPAQYSSQWEGKVIRVSVLEDNRGEKNAYLNEKKMKLIHSKGASYLRGI